MVTLERGNIVPALHLIWSKTAPGQLPKSGERFIDYNGSPDELSFEKLSEICREEMAKQGEG